MPCRNPTALMMTRHGDGLINERPARLHLLAWRRRRILCRVPACQTASTGATAAVAAVDCAWLPAARRNEGWVTKRKSAAVQHVGSSGTCERDETISCTPMHVPFDDMWGSPPKSHGCALGTGAAALIPFVQQKLRIWIHGMACSSAGAALAGSSFPCRGCLCAFRHPQYRG